LTFGQLVYLHDSEGVLTVGCDDLDCVDFEGADFSIDQIFRRVLFGFSIDFPFF